MFRAVALIGFTGALLCACGSAQRTATTTPQAPGRQLAETPASSPSASPPAAPSPVTAAITTAQPTPIPARPVPLVVYSPPGAATVAAVDAAGNARWAFRRASLGLGDSPRMTTAGTNLVAWGAGKVSVISRDGVIIGHGVYSVGTSNFDDVSVFPDPSGRRWAWMLTTSDLSSPRRSGEVWIAGLAEAPHRVFTWSNPGTATESSDDWIYLWSDEGIVVAVVPETCAPYPMETSTFLLDPSTGRQTPLEGSDRHIVDVHAGTSLGIRIDDGVRGVNSVLLGGAHQLHATMTLAGGHIAAAAISPDGSRFFATLFTEAGCGGDVHALTVQETVQGTDRTAIPELYTEGWYDDDHLVAAPICVSSSPPGDPRRARACPNGVFTGALEVVDLHGVGGTVASGDYIGVLAAG